MRLPIALLIVILLGACGSSSNGANPEVNKLRGQRDLLCDNPVVHSFRSLITNRDSIAGQETLTCFIEGKPIPFNRSFEEEDRLKTEAEAIFFNFCRESHTQNARILIKGRQIGVIERRCKK